MQETNCNMGGSAHMSLDGFSRCVRMDLQRRLGDSYTVSIGDFTKNNDTKLKGLVIKEQGNSISPTIYLNNCYQEYTQGRSLASLEEEMLEAYKKNRVDRDVDISFFTDWQKLKDKIVYKLINYGRNRELLMDVPHYRFLDLAVVFQCVVESNEKGTAGFLIHYLHLDYWGIGQEELYHLALENTPKLMEHRYERLDNFLEVDDCEKTDAYVLTNRCLIYGAGCILYKGLLQSIAEQWESNLCIIPSSVHEVILVPLDKIPDCEEMSEQIRIINETTLNPEEILSDHMYKYIWQQDKSQCRRQSVMVVKIILCIIAGTLFMLLLSAYREGHRRKNYPATIHVDGEIVSAEDGKRQSVHLEIRLKDEETGGIIK